MHTISLPAEMNRLDWIAVGLLAFFVGGILFALFLYLRTAYKAGGLKRVGRDFLVAIGVMMAWVVIRIIQNLEMQTLKDIVGRWFR